MKIVSSLVLAFLFVSNLTIGQNSVQVAIDQFVKSSELEHASVSFQVIDLSTNEVVAQHDSKRVMPTASTAKLFATATALEILGENYRPKTRLYIDGEIDSSGTLNGSLWVRGGGDPSLGSKYFINKDKRTDFLTNWVTELKKQGIKQINGDVIVDASEFGYGAIPDGWNWVDMGNYYGAGPSGLTIFDNLIEVDFSTPASPGANSRVRSISPEVPGMRFENHVKASNRSGDNAYIYGGPYSFYRFAKGTLPKGRSSFIVKGSLPDPEFQFAHEMRQVFETSGILVSGSYKTGREEGLISSNSSYSSRKLIHTHKGKTIGSLIDKTNFRSINLFAEHLVCLVGYEKTGKGGTDNGLSVLENYWSKKFNTSGMHVNDGSGLSRSNAISAANYVDLLKAMHASKNAERFKASLPVSGTSGTMRNICKGQAGHGRILAKSGSMTRIKSYAGYVNSSSGKKLAFALIVNNQSCSNSVLRQRMQNVMNKIAVH